MKFLTILLLLLITPMCLFAAEDESIQVDIDEVLLEKTEGNFQEIDAGFKQLSTDFKFYVNVAFASLAVWVGILYARSETDDNINFARRMTVLLGVTYLVHAYGDILVEAAVSFALDFLFPPTS